MLYFIVTVFVQLVLWQLCSFGTMTAWKGGPSLPGCHEVREQGLALCSAHTKQMVLTTVCGYWDKCERVPGMGEKTPLVQWLELRTAETAGSVCWVEKSCGCGEACCRTTCAMERANQVIPNRGRSHGRFQRGKRTDFVAEYPHEIHAKLTCYLFPCWFSAGIPCRKICHVNSP